MGNYDAEIVQESIHWMRSAKMELTAASQLLHVAPSLPHAVCWHSQHAAERALKAALVLESIEFQRMHDLNALCGLLPEGWIIRDMHDDLSVLTGWAIEARYPGDWSEPTHADAVEAESAASTVYDLIESGFKRRGIPD